MYVYDINAEKPHVYDAETRECWILIPEEQVPISVIPLSRGFWGQGSDLELIEIQYLTPGHSLMDRSLLLHV